MKTPNRPEVDRGVIFRLGRRPEQDIFYSDRRVPIPDDFNLGSDEKADAGKNNFAQLSVWDESLTTIEQAREFLSQNYRLPLWLCVRDVREIIAERLTGETLHVFREPEKRELPGAEGHCNVENVWPSKQDFRRIRSDLVAIATANRGDIRDDC
ncbi:MAG: hypothetical protein ACRD3J_21415 [Thermoanaerobaculia bacterium]